MSSFDPDNPHVGLFDPSQAFYLRELVALPKRWLRRQRYTRTGKVWVGGTLAKGGFKVIREAA